MCDLTPQTDYIAELRRMHAQVEQMMADIDAIETDSSATAGPSRDAAADFHPLDRAVAGDSINDGASA